MSLPELQDEFCLLQTSAVHEATVELGEQQYWALLSHMLYGAVIVIMLMIFLHLAIRNTESGDETPFKRNRGMTPLHKAVLSLTLMIEFFCTDQYQPSMPNMATEFQVPPAAMGTSMQTHQLFTGLGVLLLAPISDVVGRRPVILSFQFVLAVSTLTCGSAASYDWFMLGRALQGFSGGAVAAAVLASIRDCYDDEVERQQANGSIFAIMLLGPLVAPVIGAYLADAYGWRLSFFLITVVVSALGLLSFWSLPETAPPASKEHFFASARRVLQDGRWLQILVLIFYKGIMCMLDASNVYMLETQYQVPLQRAGLLVSALALAGLLGSVFAGGVGQRPRDLIWFCVPCLLLSAACTAFVGIRLPSQLAGYMVATCLQHFLLLTANLSMHTSFTQELSDIAGVATCIEMTSTFFFGALISLPGLALTSSQGVPGMLLGMSGAVAASQLLAALSNATS